MKTENKIHVHFTKVMIYISKFANMKEENKINMNSFVALVISLVMSFGNIQTWVLDHRFCPVIGLICKNKLWILLQNSLLHTPTYTHRSP